MNRKAQNKSSANIASGLAALCLSLREVTNWERVFHNTNNCQAQIRNNLEPF